MLKYRLMTAAVLLPLCIAAIWFFSPLWFAVLTALVVLLAAWEWSALVSIEQYTYRGLYALAVSIALGLTFFLPIIYWFMIASVIWLWALVAIVCYTKGRKAFGFDNRFVKAVTGGVLLIAFWLAANVLRNTTQGPSLLLFVLSLVWSVDTGAYFVGRRFGKHLLVPRVSPHKTWEGLIAGVTLCVLCGIGFAVSQKMSWQGIAALGALALVTAGAAVVGDLFESLLKRQAHIKDSGSIFPGHGGLLDRLDSIMAALPVFALSLVLI